MKTIELTAQEILEIICGPKLKKDDIEIKAIDTLELGNLQDIIHRYYNEDYFDPDLPAFYEDDRYDDDEEEEDEDDEDDGDFWDWNKGDKNVTVTDKYGNVIYSLENSKVLIDLRDNRPTGPIQKEGEK